MSEPMKDGKGELSLEQVKEITDGWSALSDFHPLVSARLWKEIEHLKTMLSDAMECMSDAKRVAVETSSVEIGCPKVPLSLDEQVVRLQERFEEQAATIRALTRHGEEVEVGIHFRQPSLGKDGMEKLFQVESLLRELGVSFDTGGTVGGGGVRDWEWDWSLKGPVRVTFCRFVRDDPKNRYNRHPEDKPFVSCCK